MNESSTTAADVSAPEDLRAKPAFIPENKNETIAPENENEAHQPLL